MDLCIVTEMTSFLSLKMFPLLAQNQLVTYAMCCICIFLFFGKGRLCLELGMEGEKIKFVGYEISVIYVLMLHMYYLWASEMSKRSECG